MSTSGILKKEGIYDSRRRERLALELLNDVVGESRIFRACRVTRGQGGFGGVRIGKAVIAHSMLLSWRTRGWVELVAGRFSPNQLYRRIDL